jgi:hypothetical protein
LAQLARLDPVLAARIPDLPRIVDSRNILVHGYAIADKNPHIGSALDDLLGEDGTPTEAPAIAIKRVLTFEI